MADSDYVSKELVANIFEDNLATVKAPWITFTADDGKEFNLDLVNGKFSYWGDIEPDEGAKIFLDNLGSMIDDKMKAFIEDIKKASEETKADNDRG